MQANETLVRNGKRLVERYYPYTGMWKCVNFHELYSGIKFRMFDDGELVGGGHWISTSAPYSSPENPLILQIDANPAVDIDTQQQNADGTWSTAIPQPCPYSLFVWLWKRFMCWRDEYGRKPELYWE